MAGTPSPTGLSSTHESISALLPISKLRVRPKFPFAARNSHLFSRHRYYRPGSHPISSGFAARDLGSRASRHILTQYYTVRLVQRHARMRWLLEACSRAVASYWLIRWEAQAVLRSPDLKSRSTTCSYSKRHRISPQPFLDRQTSSHLYRLRSGLFSDLLFEHLRGAPLRVVPSYSVWKESSSSRVGFLRAVALRVVRERS
ncbi:hypothetical protein SCHPADRAFT_760397 [Schizopora paradoxa]|uniref:Uncharacterized protein n=1 Tax=Schizopora paradoxa TaxID=27342 RepID=A0A0H2QXS8_9AGAM|nr:hypothetical protein SCHPADRAFT_760397 [Schizopora paradoxa]